MSRPSWKIVWVLRSLFKLRRSKFPPKAKQGEQVMDAVDRFFQTDAADRSVSTADLRPAAFTDFSDS